MCLCLRVCVCCVFQVTDSDFATFHVLPGDIIVMGSDGLLDNVADLDMSRELAELVRQVCGGPRTDLHLFSCFLLRCAHGFAAGQHLQRALEQPSRAQTLHSHVYTLVYAMVATYNGTASQGTYVL